MARLFIAEKKDLGEGVADIIGISQNMRSHLICQNGDIVTWAAGHILTLCEPHEYDPKLKDWNMEDLPFKPAAWKMKPDPQKINYLYVIRDLLNNSSIDEVVNLGDPDREGQLIIDEILAYLKNKKTVSRILVNEKSKNGISRALKEIHSNDKYNNLYHAALGRSWSDYLIGMNMTRLCTLIGRKAGVTKKGAVSFGRVQTPTLALVVRRQEEINNFISKPYWVIEASVVVGDKTFKANWIPPLNCTGIDDEGRICDENVAMKVFRRTGNPPKNGVVLNIEKKPETHQPPKIFDLNQFTSVMGKYGFSPKQALEIAQSLYNKKYTSYPRSNHQELPATQLGDAQEVLQAIAQSECGKDLKPALDKANSKLRSRAWVDNFNAEHHGIIPTSVPAYNLTEDERIGYKEIAARYILQFHPPMEGERTNVLIGAPSIENNEKNMEIYRSTGLVVLKEGWQEFAKITGKMISAKTKNIKKGREDEDETESEDEDNTELPLMKIRELLDLTPKNTLKNTVPPRHFTQTSLMIAMTNIAIYVTDPHLKKILNNSKGIGTVATRASIIEGLIRQYLILEDKKKKLSPSPEGVALIKTMEIGPAKSLMLPETTAILEQNLEEVYEGKRSLADYMSRMWHELEIIVSEAKTMKFKNVSESQTINVPCVYCGAAFKRLNGKFGYYWKCDTCGKTANDKNGVPVEKSSSVSLLRDVCPKCGEEIIRLPLRKTPGTYKWHCKNIKCDSWYNDADGKPVNTV